MPDLICQWCDQQLVEVDNPVRREVRHRRGEEVACPGPSPQADLGGIDGSGWSPGDPWALHNPQPSHGGLSYLTEMAIRRGVQERDDDHA